jgi:hypothetical protein
MKKTGTGAARLPVTPNDRLLCPPQLEAGTTAVNNFLDVKLPGKSFKV